MYILGFFFQRQDNNSVQDQTERERTGNSHCWVSRGNRVPDKGRDLHGLGRRGSGSD